MTSIVGGGLPSRKEIEHLTAEECKEELRSVFHTLENVIDNRSQDANFLQGVFKFCNRVEKLKNQPSKLASSFHMFSSGGHLCDEEINAKFLYSQKR